MQTDYIRNLPGIMRLVKHKRRKASITRALEPDAPEPRTTVRPEPVNPEPANLGGDKPVQRRMPFNAIDAKTVVDIFRGVGDNVEVWDIYELCRDDAIPHGR